MKKGNLNSFGLDLAGYDSAKQAAVLRKDGVFEVEFSADRASVAVRCFSDSFSAKSQPDTICGENQHRGQLSQAAKVATGTTKKTVLGQCCGSRGPTIT